MSGYASKVDLAEHIRSGARAEAANMCCEGTGVCGAPECIRDEARKLALLDAADWAESYID